MKAHFYFILPVVTYLTGCSIFNPDNNVELGHFRVANYLSDAPINNTVAYLYVMCDAQRPVSWVSTREYPSGQHNLWVKASFHENNTTNYALEAFVNFDMNFSEGESYQLMYTLRDDEVSIWLQDSQSSEPISEVITTPLKQKNMSDSQIRAEQCLSSSV